jgi:hypothetical protein
MRPDAEMRGNDWVEDLYSRRDPFLFQHTSTPEHLIERA